LLDAQEKVRATNRANADAFAANVLPIVREIMSSSVTNPRAIAAALNARGIRRRVAVLWHDSTVRNLLAREKFTEVRG